MTKSVDEWISLFQWFHRHPELGYEEVETTAKIKEVLLDHHIEIIPSNLKTGVIAVIRGKQPGRLICLRADIDALPVEERTNLDYASKIKGKMHACGHDFHITTALYTAVLLKEKQKDICGTIYIVFQPAEEVIGGASEVLRTGILKEVEEFYGFHAEPSLEVGEISCTPGSVMAAVDQFSINIRGKGCHGAAPWLGNNPIPVLAAITNDIYKITTDRVREEYTKVVSVTHIEAGNTWNVIPESGYLEGTVRTLDVEARKQTKKRIYEIARHWGNETGVTIDIKWHEGPNAVVNDKNLCDTAGEIIHARALKKVDLLPAMTGDDFSEYARMNTKAKSLYLKVGTGSSASLHNPTFCVDPAAISLTAKLYSEILLQRLCR